ncbi:MAG: asparaginase, partial [Cyanobacteria bacterium]|nr:asparaginase [Cyanobacteriota bacterium]
NQQEGLALKIMDGHNDIRNHYVVWLLHQLNWLSDEEYQHPSLNAFTSLSIQNSQSKKIGHYEFFRPNF